MKSAARGVSTSPLRGGRGRRQAGQAVAEMAVIFPLFLTLTLGVFWAGRAYFTYQTITRAAREACRAAAAPSCALCTPQNTYYNQSSVQTNFLNPALQAAHLDPANVKNFNFQQGVVLNPTSNPSETGTVISFNYPFTFYLPFTSVNLTQVNIFTQVQMRQEQ